MQSLLVEYLSPNEFEVVCCQSADEAIQLLEINPKKLGSFQLVADTPQNKKKPRLTEFDAVLTDIKMPGMDGLEFCKLLTSELPEVPVIVMTAYGSMETSVSALRAGAFDFVTKPVELVVLKASLHRATENAQLKRQIQSLKVQTTRMPFGDLIGECEVMTRLKDQLLRVVDSSASVLLTGESGAGKEVVARSLHSQSERADQPFVAVNCAALPESLLESELFGHKKGAFTDAKNAREGLFLQANGGTLFLDEIGELPMEMQPKLLRAIEQQTVRPVGGTEEQPFDVRLVTATNRDLEERIETGQFREDLYYRINVLEIFVPPLRVRGNDILLLASHFLTVFSQRNEKTITSIDEATAKKLLAYDWPGNVRELRNVMERAVVLSQSEKLTSDSLPEKITSHGSDRLVIAEQDSQPLAPLSEIEDRYIRYVLEKVSGNKTEAAKILGLDRKTLYRKLK